MSKKYVIEIKSEYEDTIRGIMVLGAKDSNLYMDALAVEDMEELTSDYINEHFSDLQDTAYQRGLNDAWEMAKKISLMSPDEIEKVFPGAAKYNRYNLGYSGIEAIEKLKAYEEKQKADDKIEVGDEVVDKNGYKTIVTYIYGDLFDGLCSDGSTMTNLFLDDNHKTGRHFDIDKILDEMKGTGTDDDTY